MLKDSKAKWGDESSCSELSLDHDAEPDQLKYYLENKFEIEDADLAERQL